jgi:hypothetical protein
MKSVYSAVRTGSLNEVVCLSSLKGECFENIENLDVQNMSKTTIKVKVKLDIERATQTQRGSRGTAPLFP